MLDEPKFDQKEDIFEIKDLHFDGAKMQSKKDNLDLVLQNGSGVGVKRASLHKMKQNIRQTRLLTLFG